MKKLYLLRHAKSGYEIGISDFERTLTPRGIADIKSICPTLMHRLPDDLTIYCSMAKRTQVTLQYYLDYMDLKWTIPIYKNNLYTFNFNDFDKIIRNLKEDGNQALVVGHNNALTDFIAHYTNNPDFHLPTAGFVELELDTENWHDFTKAKLVFKLFPKDLK